ncbi:LADA_0A06876g1_1 [Lachancea dasiensis]|uniref:LADA_0A06876g1_1 n=1 Tax=Lachancea dasiensis TaxID=1072105 RepID=A0A1G4IQ44_9SACH|nr:LADA_0A06876g1_1 [Lachancea dasiensis]
MLLERFHNKLHGSRFSKHSKSSSSSETNAHKDDATVPVGEVSMDEEMADVKPEEGAGNLSINTHVDNLRGFVGVSGVSTPVTTPSAQPIVPYMFMNQKRQDSVGSFASSISDMPYSQAGPSRSSVSSAPTFSPQFMRLLMDVYQDVCSDPTATPFDTTNPPPGILNRTAKVAVARAEVNGIDYGREKSALLINSVRQRLQVEVRQDCYLSRNNSMVSLPPMPLFSAADMTPPASSDYFSMQPEHQLQQPLSAPFQLLGCSSGQQQLHQQQQPLQTPFEHRPSIPKTLQRSRNDSFISAMGRSRSGSSHIAPFQQIQASSSLEPGFARSRSGSNGYFALTPTNSILGDIQRPAESRQRNSDSVAFEV